MSVIVGILQERFEWTQSKDFVENFLDHPLAFRGCHWHAFVLDQTLNDVADLFAHAILVEDAQLIGCERGKQLAVDLSFDPEPAVSACCGTGHRSCTHSDLLAFESLLS